MPPTTLPTPPADYMTNWILALIAVAMVALWVWSKLRAKGKVDVEQPVAVREWPEFATKKELQDLERKHGDELQHLHKRVTKVGDELVAAEKAITAAGENRTAGLHRRLDEQQRQIGELPLKTAEHVIKMLNALPKK